MFAFSGIQSKVVDKFMNGHQDDSGCVVKGSAMLKQTLYDIRIEAGTSQRLWVKVLGMLQQNWCVLEGDGDGEVAMVFFDDHGHVFDWRTETDQATANAALRANGFVWMFESSSFYGVAGIPLLPHRGARKRNRPIYSSGELWIESRQLRMLDDQQGPPKTQPHNSLERFVDAQNSGWYTIVEEIAAANKQTHWMWFVFPQLRGLGSSRLAEYFGLCDPHEAKNYWDHDVLGTRLRSCVELLMELPASDSAVKAFGSIDAMKLRSCMTLFESVSYKNEGIVRVLERFYQGERCPLTLEKLKDSKPALRLRFSR
jgi:uncharacterized protein (DUF1810 family)